MEIQSPYLLFLGDAPDELTVKVARGIAHWRPDICLGQLRLAGCKADLGLPDMDLDSAIKAGCKTLVVGVANRGGIIAPAWRTVLLDAAKRGMHIASGLHEMLGDIPQLAAIANTNNLQLHDVRHWQESLKIATDDVRTGHRVLGVGTDCSVGKMFTALAIHQDIRARKIAADFRATGQTGIFIAQSGISVDGVIADFIAGAAETLTPSANADHWDIVEGQGSLYHLSFSGVTLGLLHGSRPDHLILCHATGRDHMRGLPNTPMPDIANAIVLYETMGKIANPQCRVRGISVNTRSMDEQAALQYLQDLQTRHGLPATDPVRFGVVDIVDNLIAHS